VAKEFVSLPHSLIFGLIIPSNGLLAHFYIYFSDCGYFKDFHAFRDLFWVSIRTTQILAWIIIVLA
jgi:hypothetical protein